MTVEPVALLLAERAGVAPQKLCVAEDAIERRAQLVAHLADENALRLIGFLRGEFCGRELLLHGDPLLDLALQLLVHPAQRLVRFLEHLVRLRAFELDRSTHRENSQDVDIRVVPVALDRIHHGKMTADLVAFVHDRNAEIAVDPSSSNHALSTGKMLAMSRA